MFPLHSFVVRPLLLLVAVFFLLGCGSAAQQPVTPTPTAIPPTFTSVAATSTALPTATTPPPTPTAIAPADVGAESLILVTLLDGDDGTVTQAFATALTEVAASLDTDLPIRVAVTDTVASETRARPLGESYGATLLVYGAITDEGIQVTVDTPTNTLISVPTTYHDRFFPFVYLPTDISVLPDAGSTYTYLARVVIGVERALVGEMEAALATMEATLEEEATFNRGHAHFFLSNWYYSYQGEYDTAVEQVELALAEDPDLAEAFVMRGSLHHYRITP